MPLEINFKGHGGNRLSGLLNKKDNNRILISLHGFGADKNYRIIKKLSHFLGKKKVSSMTFDFSGVGESEGDVSDSSLEQMVDDANAAIRYAKKEGFKKIIVAGHSLGGMVAIIAAAANKDVHALMLMAPAIDLRRAMKKRRDTYKLAKGDMAVVAKTIVKKAFLKNISRHVYRHSNKLGMPVLIIHGDADRSCDIADSKKLFGMLKSKKKMAVIRHANHHFSGKSHLDALLDTTYQWLKHLA